MQRFELVAVSPQAVARLGAHVAIAVPVTQAAWVLPVADLQLPARAHLQFIRPDGSGLAVGVDTEAVVAGQNRVLRHVTGAVRVVVYGRADAYSFFALARNLRRVTGWDYSAVLISSRQGDK